MYDEVKVYLQQLLDMNIIRPSHSPWASHVDLVKKRDNSLRMCVDYRILNKNSKKDSYALPRIEESGQLRRQFVLCDPQRFRLGGNQIACPSRRGEEAVS
jgi:hypothetical protein